MRAGCGCGGPGAYPQTARCRRRPRGQGAAPRPRCGRWPPGRAGRSQTPRWLAPDARGAANTAAAVGGVGAFVRVVRERQRPSHKDSARAHDGRSPSAGTRRRNTHSPTHTHGHTDTHTHAGTYTHAYIRTHIPGLRASYLPHVKEAQRVGPVPRHREQTPSKDHHSTKSTASTRAARQMGRNDGAGPTSHEAIGHPAQLPFPVIHPPPYTRTHAHTPPHHITPNWCAAAAVCTDLMASKRLSLPSL